MWSRHCDLCTDVLNDCLEMVQLKTLLTTRVKDSFTLDLSGNYLLPETVPTFISWLKEFPLLRVELADNRPVLPERYLATAS